MCVLKEVLENIEQPHKMNIKSALKNTKRYYNVKKQGIRESYKKF